jgi:hypothetical protein
MFNLQYWKKQIFASYWWLTSVSLAIQEAEIRRITVQSHSGEIAGEALS